MKIKITLLFFGLFYIIQAKAQDEPIEKDTIQLKEILITSNRISIPFSQSSRTIHLITTDDGTKILLDCGLYQGNDPDFDDFKSKFNFIGRF